MSEQVNIYYRLTARYRNVKLVFLEIPPYSMVSWYVSEGLSIPESLHVQDRELFERTCYVNDFIRTKNDACQVQSPRFKLDLIKTRTATGKSIRSSVTFNQYLDGIHPNPLLARVWMKRIAERICLDF